VSFRPYTHCGFLHIVARDGSILGKQFVHHVKKNPSFLPPACLAIVVFDISIGMFHISHFIFTCNPRYCGTLGCHGVCVGWNFFKWLHRTWYQKVHASHCTQWTFSVSYLQMEAPMRRTPRTCDIRRMSCDCSVCVGAASSGSTSD